MNDDLHIPTTGLQPDPFDNRDLQYADLLGGAVPDLDWEKGFNAYEEADLALPVYDQGSSYSCVAQATSEYLRVINKILTNSDVDFSRRFIYSQITLGFNAGAYLRDGVKLISTKGDCKESSLVSYEHGNPPTEQFMLSQEGLTDEVRSEALPFDNYSYRVIPGSTGDINVFAHAILDNHGVVGGFTGSNPGWTQNVVRAPLAGESIWGHAVNLCGFGMYQGQKCLFTPNSWGGRYTIPDGRWKGLQAIPEIYFETSRASAVGDVTGAYVFNSWVLVSNEKITPNQKLMDFLKTNEGKLVQDVQDTGAFGIVKDGKILIADKDRVPELLATYIMRKEGVPTPKDIWDAAPHEQF